MTPEGESIKAFFSNKRDNNSVCKLGALSKARLGNSTHLFGNFRGEFSQMRMFARNSNLGLFRFKEAPILTNSPWRNTPFKGWRDMHESAA